MGIAKRIEIHSYDLGAYSLTVLDCAQCGEVFAVQVSYNELRRRDGKGFHCPNGHGNAYTVWESVDQRRIKELERETTRLRAEAESAKRSREWAEQRAKGANISAGIAKAAKARLEHRVNCGVCPHCQRTFKQLAAHIKTKHPSKVE